LLEAAASLRVAVGRGIGALRIRRRVLAGVVLHREGRHRGERRAVGRLRAVERAREPEGYRHRALVLLVLQLCRYSGISCERRERRDGAEWRSNLEREVARMAVRYGRQIDLSGAE